MLTYEIVKYSLLKARIKLGLPLNQDDCEMIMNHYLSRSAINQPLHSGSFRKDLGNFTINIRKKSSDIPVIYQVIINNQYKPLTDLSQKSFPGDVKYIIDAGANIGLTTLHLHKNFPDAQIISLEPDSSNFATLLKNIRANDMQNIIPMKAGLWKDKKTLKVKKDIGDGKEWAFYLEETTDTDPDNVQGYSVQEIMSLNQWPRIDILKMDIEGAERYIFEDDIKASEFLSKTRTLAIEIHDFDKIRTKILNLLKRNNFEFFDHKELTIGLNRNLSLSESV